MNTKIELQAENLYTVSLELSGQEIANLVTHLQKMPYCEVFSAIQQLETQLKQD